ncbi:MAG: N-acetyl-D-Glu racemase DgcA [Hyphomicrobium sp.]
MSKLAGLPVTLIATHETFALREPFKISRGIKTHADVLVVTVSDGRHDGRGEAVPYARYGETIADGLAALRALPPVISIADLQTALPPGAARNAVDCALHALAAKTSGIRPNARAGIAEMRPVLTAFTLSLDTPDVMAAKARAAAHLPLLKLKLGGEGDAERMAAVRAARPNARLIADANEAWTDDTLLSLMDAALRAGVEMIEQPLPAGRDGMLAHISRSVAVCADESAHTRADLDALTGKYDALNIKLDKTGGLTEALLLLSDARARGFKIMIGSMVATSLAAAPALLLAQDADWTDLDGPLLLADDRKPGLIIENGIIAPPDATVWA